MIKIAVTGASGRMGQMIIEAISLDAEVELAGAFDKGDEIGGEFDVLIDFSRPCATLSYLQFCEREGRAMVIGTTGFSDEQVGLIQRAGQVIPIVFSPNMSAGVVVSLKLLELASRAIGDISDIEIVEAHHRLKVDSPSGTALKMGEVVAKSMGQDLQNCAVYTRHNVDEARSSGTIGFSTIRGGDVVGEHTVSFFMDGERLEITHKASSRMIFATGALRAAKWLSTKDKKLYSMQDVFGF